MTTSKDRTTVVQAVALVAILACGCDVQRGSDTDTGTGTERRSGDEASTRTCRGGDVQAISTTSHGEQENERPAARGRAARARSRGRSATAGEPGDHRQPGKGNHRR
jgi:hypothetical protein